MVGAEGGIRLPGVPAGRLRFGKRFFANLHVSDENKHLIIYNVNSILINLTNKVTKWFKITIQSQSKATDL